MKLNLNPRNRYIIAVSGGRDSMALLHLCFESLPKESLLIAHFNHNIRGVESKKDQRFVEKTAKRLGLKWVCEIGEGKNTDEDSLRKQRLQFLKKVKKQSHADAILLAHHSEDQLETFLMRLIRGSGLDGLKGMAEKSGPFIRPLLKMSRTQIDNYIVKQKIKYREDKSNQNEKYFRNQLRHQVLPKLYEATERHGGKELFLKRFSLLGRELWEHHLAKEKWVTEWLKRNAINTLLWVKLSQVKWQKLSSLEKSLVYRKIAASQGLETIGREALQRVIEKTAIDKKGTPQKGLAIESSCGFLYFIFEPRKKIQISDFKIEVPASLKKGNELRFFKPGDFHGSQKLKTIFLKSRIPAPERPFVPVLAKRRSSEVVWFYPQKNPEILVKKALISSGKS